MHASKDLVQSCGGHEQSFLCYYSGVPRAPCTPQHPPQVPQDWFLCLSQRYLTIISIPVQVIFFLHSFSLCQWLSLYLLLFLFSCSLSLQPQPHCLHARDSVIPWPLQVHGPSLLQSKAKSYREIPQWCGQTQTLQKKPTKQPSRVFSLNKPKGNLGFVETALQTKASRRTSQNRVLSSFQTTVSSPLKT